jgi:hypothetical protein
VAKAGVYKNLSEAGRAHGVSPQAAGRWKKHAKWPFAAGESLNRAKLDKFITRWIRPKRKGRDAAKGRGKVLHAAAAAIAAADGGTAGAVTFEERLQRILSAADTLDADLANKREAAIERWMKNLERDRKLIRVDRVREQLLGALGQFKGLLLNFAARVNDKLEGLTSVERKIVLEGEVIALLGELKRGFEGVGPGLGEQQQH